jgi:hypothetical protein
MFVGITVPMGQAEKRYLSKFFGSPLRHALGAGHSRRGHAERERYPIIANGGVQGGAINSF